MPEAIHAMPIRESDDAFRRFPIRFDAAYRALSVALFIFPEDSYVDVGAREVRVRMGWAFSARFPRSSVRMATRDNRHPISRGVHGFGGRWLVNGSGRDIVSISLDPAPRARLLVVPVRLAQLLVSSEDADGLIAALGQRLPH